MPNKSPNKHPMKHFTGKAVLALACALAAPLSHAQDMRVATPRGASLHVIAGFPAGAGPFPTVILAPGSGYHMSMPILEDVAKQLVAHGMAVYRFNWVYFTAEPKGKPSTDLVLELQDMSAVLAVARSDARVAKDRVFVAGKSLGTGVAWSLLSSDKAIRAAVLLTPVCSRTKDGALVSEAEENYPGITAERRPLLFVAGEQDPLCAPSVLYRFAATAAGPTRVAVIGGDHSFAEPAVSGAAGEVAKQSNTQLAGLLVANFVAKYAHP